MPTPTPDSSVIRVRYLDRCPRIHRSHRSTGGLYHSRRTPWTTKEVSSTRPAAADGSKISDSNVILVSLLSIKKRFSEWRSERIRFRRIARALPFEPAPTANREGVDPNGLTQTPREPPTPTCLAAMKMQSGGRFQLASTASTYAIQDRVASRSEGIMRSTLHTG